MLPPSPPRGKLYRGDSLSEEGLKCGKLPHSLLEKLLETLDIQDEEILIGPRVGEDASVVSWKGGLLVATNDPITFASDLLGWYTVMVNANDIAVMGATPRYLLLTLLLPPGCSPDLPFAIMQQVEEASRQLSLKVIGGHSEVTTGLEHPITVGAMLGETDRVMRPSAQVGDVIGLTKGIAIEGTALLAREFPDRLLSLGVGKEALERAKGLIFQPGISVVEEALLVRDYVSSMHDPTEGGLATAVHELCISNDKGALIYEESIPILAECRLCSEKLGINPLGLIASGALLLTAPKDKAEDVSSVLGSKGITYREIGEIRDKDFGVKLARKGEILPLPYFERDEVARLEEKWEE